MLGVFVIDALRILEKTSGRVGVQLSAHRTDKYFGAEVHSQMGRVKASFGPTTSMEKVG